MILLRFKSLFIKGFGIYDSSMPPEKRLFLFDSRGINVVTGRNERGKTTLMEALMDTLYGIPDRRRSLRVPWGEHSDFSAVLDFSIKDKDYRVERNFHSHQAVLTDITQDNDMVLFRGKANPRGTGRSSREYLQTLESLGIPPRNVLDQLAFVRMMELDKGVTSEIRRIITGGSADYQSIIEELKEEYFKLTRLDPWQSGDKRKSRLLEELEEKREELQKRFEECSIDHRDILKMIEDNRLLEKDIPELENRAQDGKLIKRRLTESIHINEESFRVKEKLTELIQQKNRIQEKQKELEILQARINEDFYVFPSFEGDPEKLTHQLEKVRERLRDLSSRETTVTEHIDKVLEDKDAIETELQERYADLKDQDESFEEILKNYLFIREKNENDKAYFKEKKEVIEEMESSIPAKDERFEDLDEFSEKVIAFREEEKQVQAERSRLQLQLKEIESQEEALELAEEELQQKFPGYDKLPDDFDLRIKECIVDINIHEKNRIKIEHTNDMIKDINKKMYSPLNYALPAISLLVFFAAGALLKDWLAGLYAGSLGLFAGLFLVWIKTKKDLAEKNRLEALILLLETEVEITWEDLGIPDDFPEKDKPGKILDNYRNFQTGKANLEKMAARLSGMDSREIIEEKIANIDNIIEEGRAGLGLAPNEDPSLLVEAFRRNRRIAENIRMERKILRERFPMVSETAGLPDLPSNLIANIKRQEEIESRFPFFKEKKTTQELKSDFERCRSLEAKIQNLEIRIVQIRKSNEISIEIQKVSEEEKLLLEKLQPVMEKYGDDLRRIEEKYRHFKELQDNEKKLLFWIKEAEDLSGIEKKIAELTGDAAVLDRRKMELMDKSPILRSFLSDDLVKSNLKLKNLENVVDKALKELSGKRENLNINLYRIQQYNRHNNDPMQLQDELEEINKKIEKTKILKDSYQSAIDILSESVDEFYQSYSKVLEEHVTEIFEKMTGNTNRSVSMGKDFSLSIDGETPNPVDKEHLSSGTLDQLYFAVRIALAEGLSNLINLPFLLDDPFVYFDAGRLKNAREILDNISEKHQIIIFSHDPDFREWGRNVCDLDKLRS